MQQQPQMIPVMPSFPPANITTEQIQKYLDENKKLILAILDNQNLGKLAECAQYQALLQKNLMYLAAIADAQPPAPAITPQMAQHPAAMQVQQGSGYFMQQAQAQAHIQAQAQAHIQAQAQAQAQQQAGLFPQKMPLQFGSSPHQLQLQDPQQQLHHQQAMSGQMQMGMLRPNNGMLHHTMQHSENPGSKQDTSGSDTGHGAGPDGQGTSGRAEGSEDGK